MSWFRKSKNTVTVEFIDTGTNNPFAVSEVPIEQLPDTFELETDLEIGGQQWTVVQAIPNKKVEFTNTGKLKVFLNKAQTINPNELLFSLPTINDALFEMENTTSKDLFFIHEDDWRQMEFISKKYVLEINKEIKSINEVYEKHKVGIGFDKVHIRQIIEQPLTEENINLAELIQDLDVVKKFDGFGIRNNRAKNSFAFQIGEGIVFYGQTNNKLIIFLCTDRIKSSMQAIKKISEKYGIVFVDWCRAEITD